MPWWGLLLWVAFSEFLANLSGLMKVSLENVKNPLPDGTQRGYSCTCFIPCFSVVMLGIALAIDQVAEPWGTWGVAAFHLVVVVVTSFAILRDVSELRRLKRFAHHEPD
jgi:hypothetical protein